ncbi:MAG TPA: hypothetical protein PKN62_02910 [bacterium]|nr:hypothetical protein [bacterium]
MSFESAPNLEPKKEGRDIEVNLYGQDQLLELGVKVCEYNQHALYHYPCSQEGKAYNMKTRQFVDVELINKNSEEVSNEDKTTASVEKPRNIEIMLRGQDQLLELGVKVCEPDQDALYSYPCSQEGKAYNMKTRQFVDVEEINVEENKEA